MRASHFSKDTREFLQLLATHRVKYLLVGGEAVIYYGSARLTGDIDFFFEPNPSNARKLFKALIDFWGGDIPDIQKPEDLLTPHLIVQFGVPPNRIDLVNSITGVDFPDAWKGRIEEKIEGQGQKIPIYLIGLEQLIRNKHAVGRPKDREDLKFLKTIAAKK
jgi:predicted nucleotidyltransferase